MVSHSRAHAQEVAPLPSPVDDAAAAAAHELPHRARQAYERAVTYLGTRQHADGRVAGEVVWNTMLPAQYVLLMHVLRRPIEPGRARRIYRSLEVQRRADGAFGMHPHSPAYLFHTVLAYVALRQCVRIKRHLPFGREYAAQCRQVLSLFKDIVRV